MVKRLCALSVKSTHCRTCDSHLFLHRNNYLFIYSKRDVFITCGNCFIGFTIACPLFHLNLVLPTIQILLKKRWLWHIANRWFSSHHPITKYKYPPFGGCLYFGGSGWIRTTSGLSQQIYSLPRLSNSGARPISLKIVKNWKMR